MSIYNLLFIILIIYLVTSLGGWAPGPRFQGRNPVWVILIVVLVLMLFRGQFGMRW